MNHTQSYTINGCIFQEFLMLLGKVVHSDLILQMEYLKVENEILKSKCPKRITTTPAEKRKLIKYGLACRGKIKGILSTSYGNTSNTTTPNVRILAGIISRLNIKAEEPTASSNAIHDWAG